MNPFIIANLGFRDVLDILFLTVVAYYLYLWFRGTKAFKALVGLLVLGIVFTVARTWGLFMTTWVFQIFWQVLIILLIILFQSEIRQVLERVNPLKVIGFRKLPDPGKWIPAFARGIYALADRRVGALIILERTDLVEEWITGGHPLNGEPGPELLMSIFQKGSPLHDGAMVIKGGQVILVSCFLPLSSAERLPKEWGTRHRAAIGLTEHCDAWVIAVSEESGKISIAREGQIILVDSLKKLFQLVLDAITPLSPPKTTLMKRAGSLLTNKWQIKAGSLGLVILLWLLLAGQQDFQVNFRVPLEMKNIPDHMEILKPHNPEVQITVRGLRKDASTLSERNVHVELDLSLARLGRKIFAITRDQILLPNDRVQVVRIEPTQLKFEFKNRP
ncbi:MAG: TIGR00159 family protein [Deltaproteobacteria bacterium]|nr:TIGR00159 family protein [Deltaproteobacteria bacterium]